MVVSLKTRKALCVLYSWILFISGIVLICFAIILAYRLVRYYDFVPFNFYGPPLVIILLGILHLFLTWLGIRGPTSEHDFHILVFIIISATLFFIECGTGIWTLVLWNGVEHPVSMLMQESFNEYFDQKHYYKSNKAWQHVEQRLHCCGLNGLTDYNISEAIPWTCCASRNSTNPSCVIIEQGCREPMVDHIEWLLLQVGLTSFSAGLYQIIGIITFSLFYKFLKMERLNRSTLRRSRMNSLRRQMSHAGVDPATHM